VKDTNELAMEKTEGKSTPGRSKSECKGLEVRERSDTCGKKKGGQGARAEKVRRERWKLHWTGRQGFPSVGRVLQNKTAWVSLKEHVPVTIVCVVDLIWELLPRICPLNQKLVYMVPVRLSHLQQSKPQKSHVGGSF
jgi:hypothetical protein